MRRNRNNISLTSRRKVAKLLSFMAFLSLLVACSTTSAIPDGEQLYTGMEPTKYSNYKENQHFNDVKEELDLVLATKPNAAWLGKSQRAFSFPCRSMDMECFLTRYNQTQSLVSTCIWLFTGINEFNNT